MMGSLGQGQIESVPVSYVKGERPRFDAQIVKRSDAGKFVVLPKRWIVERTFAWLGRYHRLIKDYEDLVESSETMIKLAMTNLMIHRLQPG